MGHRRIISKMKIFNILTILHIAFLPGCGQAELSNWEGAFDISIMSFNIRYDTEDDGENKWENRKQACLDMLNETKPTIFGIQEGLYNQVTFFNDSLPSYNYVGVGRDDGHSGGEYSAIYYLSERFELLESGNFWLSESPEVPSLGWDANNIRIVTWVHLEDVYKEKSLFVFNTHFDHKGKIAREESAKLLVKRIEEIAGSDAPVFITGDFNVLIDNSILEPIIETYFSARRFAERSDTVHSFNAWGRGYLNRNIDFIFFREARAVSFKTVIKDYGVPYISDHYPIISHFEY